MKSSSSSSTTLLEGRPRIHHQYQYHDHDIKRERCYNNNNNKGKLLPFLFTSLATVAIFSYFLFFSSDPFDFLPKQGLNSSVPCHQDLHAVPVIDHNTTTQKEEKCDLFRGHWVEEVRASSLYTNSSCRTIPNSKNCFKYGRKDTDFLNWRWKPNKCELPRFDAKAFLKMVRGKKMGFIGDSVARNHMESLLCLLSPEETPMDLHKDSKDRFRRWYFPRHDFTLMVSWTEFLLDRNTRMINGTWFGIFDLHLDKVDNGWSRFLPELDYAIISVGYWFLRPLYLHEGDNLTGCVFCSEPNVTKHDVGSTIRMAFRAALNHINWCKNCSPDLLTVVRTFAPSHFENGAWNTGGYCNRTSPFNDAKAGLRSYDLKIRNIQVQETKRAKKKKGKKFGVIDITWAMLMRPDGHPGLNWENKWMKGYNDCVHWCMPGPIDYWNDFLIAVIRKESGLSS
ncbi:hypothetical protein TIFTF001_011655 [Ficus carica]|uniref:Trichome birefringence-like N-terminal domain-containing protein n=1 Tax=Ficus carica TaxID=3494 RepID=A0AA87ZZ18_FICCA|nr:hypothetical protein TIFTF001_011655 [Ficus carica]